MSDWGKGGFVDIGEDVLVRMIVINAARVCEGANVDGEKTHYVQVECDGDKEYRIDAESKAGARRKLRALMKRLNTGETE